MAYSDPALVVSNVVKAFDRPILDNITLSAKPGECIALVGPSGVGKTTLLRLIAGFLLPDAGQVTAFGADVKGASVDRLLIAQDGGLFPWQNVKQHIEFVLRPQPLPRSEMRIRCREALDASGLRGHGQKRPSELSGGMKQRVSFARAIACRSKLLLLDEPFTSIDEVARKELLRWLSQEAVSRKFTMIYVTHAIEEAVYIADRVLMLSGMPARIAREYRILEPRPRSLDYSEGSVLFKMENEIRLDLRNEAKQLRPLN